ncbi:MAG: Hemin transport system permease protein HmuU [Candidatus Heimdallarchaeota archaeon LC_2]|nr:MAG: Hemin transport system permease protein HmuU [Candidatus Heimdallarchaeota archaeon LC_2]
MQSMVKNPLVDPYITGVSSGAAFGAVLILYGSNLSFSIVYALPLSAFIGAVGSFVLTMIIISYVGDNPTNFVLSGFIVGIFFSSLTTIIIVTSENNNQSLFFWLFGSFANMNWDKAIILIIGNFTLSSMLMLYVREFNVISMGDKQASELGIDVKRLKKYIILVVSLLTAISVSFTGIIGFIGLIVPHFARILVGNDHRLLIPASMFLGAEILLIADILVRILFSPVEIPIGTVTSILGAPFFLYLLFSRGKVYDK